MTEEETMLKKWSDHIDELRVIHESVEKLGTLGFEVAYWYGDEDYSKLISASPSLIEKAFCEKHGIDLVLLEKERRQLLDDFVEKNNGG